MTDIAGVAFESRLNQREWTYANFMIVLKT